MPPRWRARPVALGFPVVLGRARRLAAQATPARRACPWRGRLRCWPSRPPASRAWRARQASNDTPWLYRLQSAASAPFVYLWHTIAPVSLTPLDVLPVDPVANPGVAVAALLALAAACLAAWTWRHRWPALAAAWAAYLALLAPAAGLVPSGLQATADRYTYLPGVVVAIAAGGGRRAVGVGAQGPGHLRRRRRAGAAGGRGRDRATRAHAVVRFRLVVVPRRRAWILGTMSACTTSERPWPQRGATRRRRPGIDKSWRCGPTMPTPGRTWIDSMPRVSNARVTTWQPGATSSRRPSATGRPSLSIRGAPIRRRVWAWRSPRSGRAGGSVADPARSDPARHRRSCGAERARCPAAPVGADARGSIGI